MLRYSISVLFSSLGACTYGQQPSQIISLQVLLHSDGNTDPASIKSLQR